MLRLCPNLSRDINDECPLSLGNEKAEATFVLALLSGRLSLSEPMAADIIITIAKKSLKGKFIVQLGIAFRREAYAYIITYFAKVKQKLSYSLFGRKKLV